MERASKAIALTAAVLYLGGCSNSTDSSDSSGAPLNLAPSEDEVRIVSIQTLEIEISEQDRNFKALEKAFKALDYRRPFCGTGEFEMSLFISSRKRELEKAAPDSSELAMLNESIDRMRQADQQRQRADQGKAKRFFELQNSIFMTRKRIENLTAELDMLRGRTIQRIKRRAPILEVGAHREAEQIPEPSLADILSQ